MRPIELNNGKGGLTTIDIGRIIRFSQIPEDRSGTLLDPEVLAFGTKIRFPKNVFAKDSSNNIIDHIVVPGVSPAGRLEKSGQMVFLHPLTAAANRLLVYMEQAESLVDQARFQRIITMYYHELMGRVTGDRGIIATNVSGTRMAHSGRLVLIPQVDRSPGWVGISAKAMKQADVCENEFVIVFRDPVIWVGSMEVLRAYAIEDDVIAMHPLLFAQFGADCDGDQLCFVKPPDQPGVAEEMKAQVLSHCRKYATWPKILCPGDLTEAPDWDNIVEDTTRRFVVTGLSYGPGDVRGWKKTPANVVAMEELIGKKDRGKINKEISIDPKARLDTILETSFANLFMKGYLGLVGAAARRLLLIMGEDPWAGLAANRCSEVIQQSTLDAKHQVGEDRAASPIDVSNMFERKNKWGTATLEQCVELLIKAEVNEEDARRVILHHRVEIPFQLFIENTFEDETVIEYLKTIVHDSLVDEQGNATKKVAAIYVLEHLALELSKKMKVEIKPLAIFEDIKENFSLGLHDIMLAFYPQFAMTHKSSSVKKPNGFEQSVYLYEQVFHSQKSDRGSLFTHL